jgi:hypothetical protein
VKKHFVAAMADKVLQALRAPRTLYWIDQLLRAFGIYFVAFVLLQFLFRGQVIVSDPWWPTAFAVGYVALGWLIRRDDKRQSRANK